MDERRARNIHMRYCEEKYDENGMLCEFNLKYPDDFNFGYDVIDEIAVNTPDRRAMLWCNPRGEEREFTFGDIKHYSDKTANYFRILGIGKGDPVMVVLKRHYQYWFVAIALHKLGAILIPATFMLTEHDVDYRVNAASIKAVVCCDDSGVPEAVDEVMYLCPTLKTRILVGGKRDGWFDYDEGMKMASDVLERVPTKVTDPMLIYFSSGTTGYPKMALHNHTYGLGHLYTAKHWHNLRSNSLHLTIADTGWAKASWGKLYGQWFMEGCLFVYDFDKFVASEILALLEKYRVTSLCCPPTMYRMLLNEGVGRYDLSAIRYATTAGEALNPDVFENWKAATGIEIMDGFGQSETTVCVCNTVGMTPRPGSCGKPALLYDIALLDADGERLQPGIPGEICINMRDGKQPGLMMEYYRDEEKTAKAMHDGWYHTGDLATMDEDGYIWYVGRNDDIIKSSGYRIGPFEIESVLLEHDAVADCAVTGVPDSVRGQLVKATIVLHRDFEPSDELIAELQEYVKHRTAPYKYPRVVSFVDELPRTTSGKIRRVEIRENDLKTAM